MKKLSIIILLSILSFSSSLSNAAWEETWTQPNNWQVESQNDTQKDTNWENTNSKSQNNWENTKNTTNEIKEESLENEIKKVEIDLKNKIKIFLTQYVNFKNNYVNWEFKVLKQLKIWSAIKDSQNKKLINLTLIKPLEKNSTYNILDVNNWTYSIDFDTKDSLENVEIKNKWLIDSSQIDYIKIVNPTTIEIYSKKDIETEDFSFNLFNILHITDKKWYNQNGENYIELTFDKNLWKDENYILTILELKTSNWNKINFTDSWYKEFSSLEENNIDNNELQALDNKQAEDPQTAQTALNTEQTPDTWTATNILLILTFILSTLYVIYTRKKA